MKPSSSYTTKIAKLIERRDNTAERARDEARYEIGRMVRHINKRFPRHKFYLYAGMGAIVVYCDKKIFGDENFSFDSWKQTALVNALERSPGMRELRGTIKAMTEIAESMNEEFQTCVDLVNGEE